MKLQALTKYRLNELRHSELEKLRDIFRKEEDIEIFLLDNGWTELGKGAFSKVYGHPSSRMVIKVLMRMINMKTESARCGLQWIRYCHQNHHSNNHLMRVYYVQTQKLMKKSGWNGTKYFVVMEKLQPFRDAKELWSLFNLKTGDNEKLIQYNAYMAACIFSFSGSVYLNMGREKLYQLIDDYANIHPENPGKAISDSDVLFEAIQNGFPLAKAVYAMMEISGNSNCMQDIHMSNIMLRPGTKDLVITDPLQDE